MAIVAPGRVDLAQQYGEVFRDPLGNPRVSEGRAVAAEIVRSLSSVWKMEDGPPVAYIRYRQRQGEDGLVTYLSFDAWGPKPSDMGRRQSIAVVADLKLLSAMTPVLISGVVRRYFDASPETHMLVWRHRPEVVFNEKSGGWEMFARVAPKPHEAWYLEEPPDPASRSAGAVR